MVKLKLNAVVGSSSNIVVVSHYDWMGILQAVVKSNAVASLKTIFTQEIFTEQVLIF